VIDTLSLFIVFMGADAPIPPLCCVPPPPRRINGFFLMFLPRRAPTGALKRGAIVMISDCIFHRIRFPAKIFEEKPQLLIEIFLSPSISGKKISTDPSPPA